MCVCVVPCNCYESGAGSGSCVCGRLLSKPAADVQISNVLCSFSAMDAILVKCANLRTKIFVGTGMKVTLLPSSTLSDMSSMISSSGNGLNARIQRLSTVSI